MTTADAVFVSAVDGEVREFLACTKIIGNLEPLLSVGVEAAEMAAGQLGGTRVTKHGYQSRICVLNDSE